MRSWHLSLPLVNLLLWKSTDANDAGLQLCPLGTVQLALDAVSSDYHASMCAKAVGVSTEDILTGSRLSTEQVKLFRDAKACETLHEVTMTALKSIVPVCVDPVTMLTTFELGSISFRQRVDALTD